MSKLEPGSELHIIIDGTAFRVETMLGPQGGKEGRKNQMLY